MKGFIKFLIVIFFLNPFIKNAQEQNFLNILTFNIQRGSHYNSKTTLPAVSEIITKHNIDLLGTQELDVYSTKQLCTYLPDYNWFGVGRDDGKESGESVCIIYNKNKFTLLDQSTFWLSETPEIVGSMSWNTDNTRIVTWGKFRRNSDSSIFYLFNTHFDHISSRAREESSKLILKKIWEITGKLPVIITGDFNFEMSSKAYKILTDHYYNYLQFFDSKYISKTPNIGPGGTFNNFTNNNPTEKIDFIFTNPFWEVYTHEVITEKYDDQFISDHFPVKIQVGVKFPDRPKIPSLTAVSGNNKVTLYWDSSAENETVETFTDSTNDFQGYKLYKSKNPDMSDAVLINGNFSIPLLRKPIFECDLNDSISGYTNYGIVDGFGYYLGNNSGIRNYFEDEDVINGETYYYVLIAYDKGIPNMADGFPPMESPYYLIMDKNNVADKSLNVALGKPSDSFPNSYNYAIGNLETKLFGTGNISVKIIDPDKLQNKSYKLKFIVDTININSVMNNVYRSERDIYFVNSGLRLFNENDSIIYSEDKSKYPSQNIEFNPYLNYHYLNNIKPFVTEQINGFQIVIENLIEFAKFDSVKSGWKIGNSNINLTPSASESHFFPWNFEIRFGEKYTGITSSSKGIHDIEGNNIGIAQLLFNREYNFTVYSKDYPNEKLDIITYDIDMNGSFEIEKDKLLIGYAKTVANKTYWSGTVCDISFENSLDNLPKSGDIYEVYFNRPFSDSDEFRFTIDKSNFNLDSVNSLNSDFTIDQNFPNPFNNTTNIKYFIKENGNYKLSMFNIIGEEVAVLFDTYKNTGGYELKFDAGKLVSGIYIYVLRNKKNSVSKKMIFIK